MTMLEIIVVIAGALLGLGVLVMIFNKVDVSTGHSVVMGIAAVLFCLPFVASLEWTGDGVKLETKAIAKAVTAKVSLVAESQATTGQGLLELTAKLEAADRQLAELQNAVKDLQEGKVTPFTADPVPKDAYKGLLETFAVIKQSGQETFEETQSLTKALGDADRAYEYLIVTPEQRQQFDQEFFKLSPQK